MFCGKCGTKASEGSTFCASCGANLNVVVKSESPLYTISSPTAAAPNYTHEQQPNPHLTANHDIGAKARKKTRNVIFVVAAIVVVAAVILSIFLIARPGEAGKGKIEGEGYNTAEEAASAYANAFFNVDIDGILRACAVETYVENYDSLAYLKRYAYYSSSNDFIWSALSGFDKQLTAEIYASELALHVQRQYTQLCLSDVPEFDGIVNQREIRGRIVNEDFAHELYEALRQNYTADRLQTIDNYTLLTPEDFGGDAYASFIDESWSEIRKPYTSVRGADESADFVAIFDIGGDKWALSIGTYRYGDTWYANPVSFFSYIIETLPEFHGIARVSEIKYVPSGSSGNVIEVVRHSIATGQRIEGSGARTPDMAVATFMEGFTNADIGKMLEATAVETYVENYDFLSISHMAYIDRVIIETTVPVNTLDFRLSAMVRAKTISDRIRSQYILQLTSLMDDYGSTPFRFTEEKEAEDFYDGLIRSFDTDRLMSIRDYEIVAPHDFDRELYSHISDDDPTLRRHLEMRGADEYAEFVVTYSFEGEDWLMFFGVIRYADSWFVEPGFSYWLVGAGPVRAPDKN